MDLLKLNHIILRSEVLDSQAQALNCLYIQLHKLRQFEYNRGLYQVLDLKRIFQD